MKEHMDKSHWSFPSSIEGKFWLFVAALGIVAGLYTAGLYLFSPPNIEPDGITIWGGFKTVVVVLWITFSLHAALKSRKYISQTTAWALIGLGVLSGIVWDVYPINGMRILGGLLIASGCVAYVLSAISERDEKEI